MTYKLSIALTRFIDGSTSYNCSALLAALDHPQLVRAILFASPETAGTPRHSREAETNLPLLSALVEIAIEPIALLRVVFDGEFLTAQRYPRYQEVRDVLDRAVSNGRVHFAPKPVDFTAALSCEEAAEALLAAGPFVKLDAETRPTFFRLLSTLTEQQFQELNRSL